MELLRLVASSKGCDVSDLKPRDPLDDRRGALERLEGELGARGVHVAWDRIRTVRGLVGLLVPLRERRPRAHH